jgi:hypothetical protein
MDPQTATNFETRYRRQLDHKIGHALARDGLRGILEKLAPLRGSVVNLVMDTHRADEDEAFNALIFGAGAFLLFRALPPTKIVERLSLPGRVALGAYAIHPEILWLPMAQHTTLGGTAMVIAATAILSVAVSQLCSTIPVNKLR